MEDIKYFFELMWDGMGYKHNIFGYRLSFQDIFIYGAIGSILATFVRRLINGE